MALKKTVINDRQLKTMTDTTLVSFEPHSYGFKIYVNVTSNQEHQLYLQQYAYWLAERGYISKAQALVECLKYSKYFKCDKIIATFKDDRFYISSYM